MIWKFHIKTEKDLAYILADELGGILTATSDGMAKYGTMIVSLFEDKKDQMLWTLEGTLESEPQENDLRRVIDSMSDTLLTQKGLKLPYEMSIEKLPDIDWLAENRRQFPALEIAGFYIYGSHIKAPKSQKNITLKIDASTAFGTGNHGTTHGCLQALQDLKSQGLNPQNPLDLGTGTGILAMAISKLFDVKVLATDLDVEAVEKTKYNAIENDLGNKINVLLADGFQNSDLQKKMPFDLIIANILAGPLMDMAQELKRCLKSGGTLILSGILDHQVAGVKKAYQDDNVCLISETLRSEWATLVFEKAKEFPKLSNSSDKKHSDS